MENALAEVMDGKIPNDRIVLKVLWEEVVNWPALDMDRQNQKNKTSRFILSVVMRSLVFLVRGQEASRLERRSGSATCRPRCIGDTCLPRRHAAGVGWL